MFAMTDALSEFQIITLCVIATILTVYPLALVTVGLLGVLHRSRNTPAPSPDASEGVGA